MSDFDDLGNLLDRLLALREREKGIAEAAREVGREIDAIIPTVLRAFVRAGVSSFKLSGGETVYLARDLLCSGSGQVETCAALREVGWDDLVQERYDAAGLKSKIKELEEEENEKRGFAAAGACSPADLLPEPVRGRIKIVERFEPRVLGARARAPAGLRRGVVEFAAEPPAGAGQREEQGS